MKILHMILPSKRMMKTFVDTVQTAYPDDEHMFYATRKVTPGEVEFFSAPNMIRMEGANRKEKLKHFASYCKEADIVIWHGFVYPLRMMAYLYVNRSILKKSVWVMWGIDLYNYKLPSNSLKAKLSNHINRVCREQVKVAIALCEPDKDVYEQEFKHPSKCIVAPYPISYESFDIMDRRRDCAPRDNGVINVQIGNNAHSFNNHFRAIESIEMHDSEKVHYYFPLSYGDQKDWAGNKKDYKTELLSLAQEKFPNRVHPIQKMMQQNDYTNFLWSVDIAILDADRQNALGNMLKLLYMGSKVFLSPENPMYEYFKSQNLNVCNAREIPNMTTEEFLSPVDSQVNIDWITQAYYPPYAISKWADVFAEFGAHYEKSVVESLVFETHSDSNSRFDTKFSKKPGYISVTPFSSAERKLPSKWKYALLMGNDEGVLSLTKSVSDSRPFWFLSGRVSLGEENSSAFEAIDKLSLSLFARLDEINLFAERVGLIIASYNPQERVEIFQQTMKYYQVCKDKLEQDLEQEDNGFKETNQQKSDSAFISSQSQIGMYTEVDDYAVVSSGSRIAPLCKIGKAAMVDGAVMGVNSQLGDFSVMMPGSSCGVNCVIGKQVLIASGVVVPDNSIIPDNSVINA